MTIHFPETKQKAGPAPPAKKVLQTSVRFMQQFLTSECLSEQLGFLLKDALGPLGQLFFATRFQELVDSSVRFWSISMQPRYRKAAEDLAHKDLTDSIGCERFGNNWHLLFYLVSRISNNIKQCTKGLILSQDSIWGFGAYSVLAEASKNGTSERS